MNKRRSSALICAGSVTFLSLSGACSGNADSIQEAETSPPSTLTWKLAADAAPPGIMDFVAKTEIDPSWFGDTGRMSVAAIVGRRGETFYLVSPKVTPPKGASSYSPSLSPLCGTKGCRYLGYALEGQSFRKVFDTYLYDLLPPNVPLFQLQPTDGIPCLEVTQYPPAPTSERSLSTSRYCYDGHSFVLRGTNRKYPNSK